MVLLTEMLLFLPVFNELLPTALPESQRLLHITFKELIAMDREIAQHLRGERASGWPIIFQHAEEGMHCALEE